MKVAEPLHVGGVVIEEVDIRALSDDDVLALNTFGNVLRAEERPEDPPRPVEQTRASVDTIPAAAVLRMFWARDDTGALAATGQTSWLDKDENRHLASASVHVRADHRRRGIARALLRLIVDVAEADGRTLLMGVTSERVPAGEAFARRVGAEPGQAVHTNRLLLSEVDRDLVRRWIDEGPGRAPGYSLVSIDGRYPEDLIEAIRDAHDVMNTAPRDDLDMEDQHWSVEEIRDWEKSMFAQGDERWSLFARHDDSGELVGITEVAWNPARPKTVEQMATAVRPDHRGHALGKWLKAAMLQRVLDERREAEEIRTGNADSNDAMLGINKQLGFKPYIAATAWQVRTERARAYLDGTG